MNVPEDKYPLTRGMSDPVISCNANILQGESSCGLPSSLCEFKKRSREESIGHTSVPDAKRCKPEYFFVLESESEKPTDEDTESELSIQGKETDFAKDTSDTSLNSDWSDITTHVEYEIASSSHQPSFDSASLSSETDDLMRTATVIGAVIDDDLALFADTSDSESDPVFDPELPRKDYWTCLQCRNKNNNPLFRYCEKCFRLRKDFLPPRPRHRRRKKSPSDTPLPAVSSGVTDISSSDNTMAKSSSELTTDSGYQGNEPCSPQPSTSKILDHNDGPEMCITCMVRPKNGIFVHSKIGHICCCYKCAVKVWKRLGRCPLCHGKVKTVLQAFYG